MRQPGRSDAFPDNLKQTCRQLTNTHGLRAYSWNISGLLPLPEQANP